MALTNEEIEELKELLDTRDISHPARNARPKLRLVVPPTPRLLDTISRDLHERRIVHLKRAYGLGWLVDQECFNVPNLFALEDCDLIRLHGMMERARECVADGVSFDDVGLVRSLRDDS